MKKASSTEAFERLKALYQLFDEQVSALDLPLCCKPGCAACCTRNLTLTSLEARFLIENMPLAKRTAILEKCKYLVSSDRYLPKLSLNAFARYCIEGREVPGEEIKLAGEACVLLEDGLCSLYAHRPIGCRILLSTQNCSRTGEALMPEHLLTLNHLFVQFIEQIDKNGVTSNLADLMFHLLSEQYSAASAGDDSVKGSHHLILNEPISVLMVPPEHQDMMGPVVEKIKAILR